MEPCPVVRERNTLEDGDSEEANAIEDIDNNNTNNNSPLCFESGEAEEKDAHSNS